VRLFVNAAQLAGLGLIVAAAAITSVALACLVAGVALCGLSWLHDPDRRGRP
jgi:hypothetical protein